jgi:hypothetical protein
MLVGSSTAKQGVESSPQPLTLTTKPSTDLVDSLHGPCRPSGAIDDIDIIKKVKSSLCSLTFKPSQVHKKIIAETFLNNKTKQQ